MHTHPIPSRSSLQPTRHALRATAFAVTLGALLGACRGGADAHVVRLGHFPNVTHVHGLVAHAMSRQGKGIFERHLGMPVEWYVFQAGPSAMEALLAGSLDATYVGPNPALNAHFRTRGDEVRVLAGATEGGAALVVREAAGIRTPADFRGKRIATPQLGNTQDVACRAWLAEQGFTITQTGGDVLVVPTENPSQLALFQKGELDAAWTVEPWVSRLEREGGGRIFVEEQDALTTVFCAGTGLLARRPERGSALQEAHRELTAWIAANPQEARELVRTELQAITGRPIAAELVERCFARMTVTDRVELAAFEKFVERARQAGFVPGAADLTRLLHRP
jgi:NitT/TauT family transport system substrate-binding protein